ncbi:hypothetical protein J6590_052144 [Homalodisca vitripennis]|nr:hypothetical protein J6590_052144 [Homalodisca vitripennis]
MEFTSPFKSSGAWHSEMKGQKHAQLKQMKEVLGSGTSKVSLSSPKPRNTFYAELLFTGLAPISEQSRALFVEVIVNCVEWGLSSKDHICVTRVGSLDTSVSLPQMWVSTDWEFVLSQGFGYVPLSCTSPWATGLCEDLVKQNKGESRYSTRSKVLSSMTTCSRIYRPVLSDTDWMPLRTQLRSRLLIFDAVRIDYLTSPRTRLRSASGAPTVFAEKLNPESSCGDTVSVIVLAGGADARFHGTASSVADTQVSEAARRGRIKQLICFDSISTKAGKNGRSDSGRRVWMACRPTERRSYLILDPKKVDDENAQNETCTQFRRQIHLYKGEVVVSLSHQTTKVELACWSTVSSSARLIKLSLPARPLENEPTNLPRQEIKHLAIEALCGYSGVRARPARLALWEIRTCLLNWVLLTPMPTMSWPYRAIQLARQAVLGGLPRADVVQSLATDVGVGAVSIYNYRYVFEAEKMLTGHNPKWTFTLASVVIIRLMSFKARAATCRDPISQSCHLGSKGGRSAQFRPLQSKRAGTALLRVQHLTLKDLHPLQQPSSAVELLIHLFTPIARHVQLVMCHSWISTGLLRWYTSVAAVPSVGSTGRYKLSTTNPSGRKESA